MNPQFYDPSLTKMTYREATNEYIYRHPCIDVSLLSSGKVVSNKTGQTINTKNYIP